MDWLFESKKRFGLTILNYMVTSNHIHLLVMGEKDQEIIPKSVQLIAGRTAQEYNQRIHLRHFTRMGSVTYSITPRKYWAWNQSMTAVGTRIGKMK